MELLNMPPRLLVFDMDGTFMDSQIFHAKTFHRFINRYIAPIDFETTRRKMGNTVRHILTEAGVPPEEMAAVYAQLTEFCEHDIDDLIAEVGVIDGIRDALVNARARGLRCIVLTNSMETVAKKMLTYHGLLTLFDNVSGADLASNDKVDRCNTIIKSRGFCPADTVCIGDSEFDIEMANSVGTRSCFVKTDYSWYRSEAYIMEYLKPTYVVSALNQIPDVFYGGESK